MERVVFAESFNRAPFVAKVKKRIKVDKFVVLFGVGLNALVLSIIFYAHLFL